MKNTTKYIALITIFLGLSSCKMFEKKAPEFQVLSDELPAETEKSPTPIPTTKIKQKYVTGSQDIPLFTGLKQVDDDNASFDTISGNITISTYESGKDNLEKIRNFYLGTLPQLGWKLEKSARDSNKLSYKRTDENLEISFEKNEDKLLIKFFISSSM